MGHDLRVMVTEPKVTPKGPSDFVYHLLLVCLLLLLLTPESDPAATGRPGIAKTESCGRPFESVR